jgi:hypothetical protein
MSLIQVEWACHWPLVFPYFEGSVPAGFPSPAEDYLETPLDLSEYLIENKAATFMMRVDALSVRLGERLWRDGFRYSKCGVMITELLPETMRQPALWSEPNREKRDWAWKTMDKLNARHGRDTVRILGAGPKEAAWKLRAEHRSPRWTTRWDELPQIRAK